jgi:hypothetical protein
MIIMLRNKYIGKGAKRMDKHAVLEVIERYWKIQQDRKCLTCSDAYKIAEELKVNLSDIGKICNENGIKIIGCQLDCF